MCMVLIFTTVNITNSGLVSVSSVIYPDQTLKNISVSSSSKGGKCDIKQSTIELTIFSPKMASEAISQPLCASLVATTALLLHLDCIMLISRKSRGVTWMSDLYVCMHKHASLRWLGACSPRKGLETDAVNWLATITCLGLLQVCRQFSIVIYWNVAYIQTATAVTLLFVNFAMCEWHSVVKSPSFYFLFFFILKWQTTPFALRLPLTMALYNPGV